MTSLSEAIQNMNPGDHILMRRENTDIHQLITSDISNNKFIIFLNGKEEYTKTLDSESNNSNNIEVLYFEKLCGKSFDPDCIFDAVQPHIKKTQKPGFNLTIVNDMTWITQNVNWEDLIKFEAQITDFCSTYGAIWLCLYPDSPSHVFSGISTHPLILFNNTLYKNMYYIPDFPTDASATAYLNHIKNIRTFENNIYMCRTALSNAPEIICLLDTNGQILTVNPAIKNILGYTPQEIQGKQLSTFIHPDDIEKVSVFIDQVKTAENHPLDLQFTLKTKEGNTKIGEFAASPFYDAGTIQGITGVFRDITGQKNQKENTEFLAEIVENIMEAVVITNPKGIITYANAAACTMFGYAPKELEGELANMLNSENSPITFQEILIKQKDWEGEMVAIKKNGEKFPIWSKISVMRSEKGDMTALVSVSRDITKRKEAEEKLQRYALLLEMKVREKTRGTETLLKTNYALRSTSNWKEGIEIITRGVEGLGFDRAAVFFVNEHEKVLECKGHLNMSDRMLKMKISLDDTRYPIVKCIRDRKPVVGTESPDMQAVPGEAEQFVWVPILFQSAVLGAIGADKNKSKTTIQPEDVDMLELYANQIAEFIERTRMVVEPKVEPQVSTPLKYQLEVKEVYLVAGENPDLAYDMFTDLVKHGFHGFGICRTHPQKIREKYTLERTPIMWLSEIESKHLEHVGPQDIPKLSYLVTEFIKRAQPAVILMEGVEYLMVQNDFNTVLKLLHSLSDYIVTSKSILLVPINPDALPAHQCVMLKQAFTVLNNEGQ